MTYDVQCVGSDSSSLLFLQYFHSALRQQVGSFCLLLVGADSILMQWLIIALSKILISAYKSRMSLVSFESYSCSAQLGLGF